MKLTSFVAVLGLSACATRSAPPANPSDPRIAELEARIATLESAPKPRADDDVGRSPKKRKLPVAPPTDTATANEVADLRMKVHALETAADELSTQVELLRWGDLRAQDPKYAWKPGTPRPQLKPDVVYSVPIDRNPMLGDPSARVTWVIGIELTEPYTRRLLEAVKTVRQQFGADLRVVFKHNIVHDYGLASAMYLCAAEQQGKFEQGMETLLDISLSADRLQFRAGGLARAFSFLDRAQREASLAGPCKKIVRDDHLFAQRMAQGAVPYSFVNGRYLGGAQPVEAWVKLIEEELAKAKAVLGEKPGKGYYATLVKNGQKQP